MSQVEAETILQPSLHTIPEYVGLVLDEAECRGVDVADLRGEYDAAMVDPDGAHLTIHSLCDDTLSRLHDAGYANVEDNDTLLIMPKGVDLPAEWNDGP